jgi:hypothetical protein
MSFLKRGEFIAVEPRRANHLFGAFPLTPFTPYWIWTEGVGSLVSKLRAIYKEMGISGLGWRGFSYVYKNAIRPAMPVHSTIFYGGIPIGRRKIGDSLLSRLFNPPLLDDIPGYEHALVSALRNNIREGDNVVVVGGGVGVTATIAAIAVGENGSVKCFEGDMHGVVSVQKTAALSRVGDRIKVYHAIVGEEIDVWGSSPSNIAVRPNELPSCDVLELDCEGSEIGILRDMLIKPRVVAVETHGFLGSPTADVRNILEHRGYQVSDLGLAEPRLEVECDNLDIRVLVGRKWTPDESP